jgi:hypothetical protein
VIERAAAEVLEVVLESWERHNTIMGNLLRVLPPGGLEVAAPGSRTVGQQFAHLIHERLISVAEEAPEHAVDVPAEEWARETDVERLAGRLAASAAVVRAAVAGRVAAARELDLNYGHPVLMLQLLLWHEAYHHGRSSSR